jgi:peroxiredoxin
MTEKPALRPKEGWNVLHLFYQFELGAWHLLSTPEKLKAKTALAAFIQECRELPSTQLLVFSMVTPKADLGFMLLTDDLHQANALEKRLSQLLGPDVLSPVFHFYSLTERSEYTTIESDYAQVLNNERGLTPESAEYQDAMKEFNARMAKYLSDRLYPNMPDWPVFCFYPMTKRRSAEQNWYALPFDERKKLMLGHARVGRQFSGRVRQLITGATGLDDWEWGVSLFAHDIFDIKNIVYEMRFDQVSAQYADFGEFYIGLQVSIDEIFRRLQL